MRRTLLTAAAALVLATAAAPALGYAQPGGKTTKQENLRPPTVGKQDTPPIVRTYLILAALVAITVGANLIPSKRGHQD